jgi:hypothetical protein
MEQAAPSQETAQETATPAGMYTLSNGTPVIIQRSPLSPTATLKVITPSADYTLPAGAALSQPALGQPAWGLSSLDFEILPAELERAIQQAQGMIRTATPLAADAGGGATDPVALLENTFNELPGLSYPQTKPAGPVLLVVTGDVDPARALGLLENGFGHASAEKWLRPASRQIPAPAELERHVSFAVAQEQLGYLVQVPGPLDETRAAWQMTLYILTHGYEGRLGKAAISEKGLVYYIDSAWRSDGTNDWITISTGVDPQKLDAMKALLREQLDLLISRPPSTDEIEAARNHLLGRFVSAAQSNGELAESLARQWILHGSLPAYDDLKRRLDEVSRQDILQLLPAFSRGTVVSVRNPPAKIEQ